MFRYYSVLYKLIRHDSLQLCMVSINHLGHQIEVVRCYMTKVQYIYEQAFISFSLTRAPRFDKIGYFWYLVHFFVQLCQDEISHPNDFFDFLPYMSVLYNIKSDCKISSLKTLSKSFLALSESGLSFNVLRIICYSFFGSITYFKK